MKICKVEGCKNSHFGLGYCNKHYSKFKKYGDPLYVILNMDHNEICSIDGCNNKYHAKDLCFKHYKKLLKYGDPLIKKISRKREHHGLYKSPEYKVWLGMNHRCSNKNNNHYHRYGGRGIAVCNRWKNSFLAFYEDMGNRPKGTEIDRINNDGNYEPGNCRWVTPLVNIRNSTTTKLTEEQVKEIRDQYKTGKFTHKKLAVIYKVGKSTIGNIVTNTSWKEEVII